MQLPTIHGTVATYNIRAYEVDSKQLIQPPALLKLMHETAMENVIRLKMSAWDLEHLNLSWVLMRMYIQFYTLPKVGETVQVMTYPAGFEKLLTYRDYLVFDEQGNKIAEAGSTWLLMDTTKRRMASLPTFITDLNKDLPSPEDCLPRFNSRFSALRKIDFSQSATVGWYDLDWNTHLNNVQYLRWMLESLGDVPAQQQLQRIEIQYRAECTWKEKLVAEAEQLDQHTFLHQLRKTDTNTIAAQTKTIWK